VVVLEQPRSHQPFGGRGRVSAVQHRSSGEVERLAVVAQAAGDLAVVDEPWSWSERVAVVTEPCQDLAGVSEARFEVFQRVDGSGQRPSQTARQLLGGARLSDARQQRLDGAVIGGAVPVDVVEGPRPG
jgi:hypothetical protein